MSRHAAQAFADELACLSSLRTCNLEEVGVASDTDRCAMYEVLASELCDSRITLHDPPGSQKRQFVETENGGEVCRGEQKPK